MIINISVLNKEAIGTNVKHVHLLQECHQISHSNHLRIVFDFHFGEVWCYFHFAHSHPVQQCTLHCRRIFLENVKEGARKRRVCLGESFHWKFGLVEVWRMYLFCHWKTSVPYQIHNLWFLCKREIQSHSKKITYLNKFVVENNEGSIEREIDTCMDNAFGLFKCFLC